MSRVKSGPELGSTGHLLIYIAGLTVFRCGMCHLCVADQRQDGCDAGRAEAAEVAGEAC